MKAGNYAFQIPYFNSICKGILLKYAALNSDRNRYYSPFHYQGRASSKDFLAILTFNSEDITFGGEFLGYG
jgi:hypothetical protein